MRKFGHVLIIVIFVFFMGSCEKDVELTKIAEKSGNEDEAVLSVYSNADDSQIDESTKDKYLHMASYFAQKKSDDNDVALPQEIVDKYYHAFIKLYNAQELYCRDSIVGIYKSFFNYYTGSYDNVSYIYLWVDSNETWHQEWIEGNIMTGNYDIDIIMTKYNFETVTYLNGSLLYYSDNDTFYRVDENNHPFFLLRTDNYFNMNAMANLFENIPGIMYANAISKFRYSFPSSHWSPSNIQLVDGEDSITLTFSPSYSWSSTYKWWKFDVHSDGKVEFVEKY